MNEVPECAPAQMRSARREQATDRPTSDAYLTLPRRSHRTCARADGVTRPAPCSCATYKTTTAIRAVDGSQYTGIRSTRERYRVEEDQGQQADTGTRCEPAAARQVSARRASAPRLQDANRDQVEQHADRQDHGPPVSFPDVLARRQHCQPHDGTEVDRVDDDERDEQTDVIRRALWTIPASHREQDQRRREGGRGRSSGQAHQQHHLRVIHGDSVSHESGLGTRTGDSGLGTGDWGRWAGGFAGPPSMLRSRSGSGIGERGSGTGDRGSGIGDRGSAIRASVIVLQVSDYSGPGASNPLRPMTLDPELHWGHSGLECKHPGSDRQPGWAV